MYITCVKILYCYVLNEVDNKIFFKKNYLIRISFGLKIRSTNVSVRFLDELYRAYIFKMAAMEY